ncbi:MAG: O-antigen ligase family protein, partial [Patescibacteria group bacterium]|nr:O-antigen ligase family protein [Patescibacteria group bacterium]
LKIIIKNKKADDNFLNSDNMLEKTLKYAICLGLAAIAFIPILMYGGFFFPFIFSKALVFRVIVEIIFVLYLLLISININYRPRFTIIFFSFLAYIVLTFISSLFGSNFYLSFWGDIERSEGILLLLHLFAFFIVISGFIRSKKEWLLFFDTAIIGTLLVSFFALGQRLNLDFVLNAGQGRLSATIGNPAFLAGYLIFGAFFALFLFFQRENRWLKKYYILAVMFELYIIIQTATRGAFVGLAFSLFLALFLIIFFTKVSKKIKRIFLFIVLILFLFGNFVYFNQNISFVKNSEFLRRMSSISLSDRTTETRLMTWDSAWQGIKEKPLLGYGYENFNLVFNKHFNPGIYEDPGSRIWFDRAHNVIFDRAVAGGIIGLLAYVFLIFYPVYFLFKKMIVKKEECFVISFFKKYFLQKKAFQKISEEGNEHLASKTTAIIFISLIFAYFIQNLFVFDVLVVYIPLVLMLGFLSFYDNEFKFKILENKQFYKIFSAILLILFLPIMYLVNIKPAKANLTTVQAMRATSIKDFESAYNLFLKAISYNTYGNQEYRIRFTEFVNTMVYKKDGTEIFRRDASLKVSEELKKQILERPNDVANYILLMRHYNRIYIYDINLLNDVIAISKQAESLSPTRPHIFYERGYAQIYLGNYYTQKNEKEIGKEFYKQAIQSFEKAINLNDQVEESYINLILMLMVSHQTDKIENYLNKMDELAINYKKEECLKRMASAAVNTEEYVFAIKFYKELTEICPDKPKYWIDLALSYAYSNNKEKAIETAEKVKSFGGNYELQANEFIKKVSDENFELD